ncbi:MAG: hypothetical protein IBX70_06195 [Clostridia bacterium]|nr:hypothetical protein [Clostridia bacterium]
MKIGNMLQSLTQSLKISEKPSDGQTIKENKVEVPKFSGEDAKALNALFSKYNKVPDRQTINEVTEFMNAADGDVKSKLETVEMALYKGVDLKSDQLMALHSALQVSPEDLQLLLDDNVVDRLPKSDVQKLIHNLKFPEAVKAEIIRALESGQDLKSAVVRAIQLVAGVDSKETVLLNLSKETVATLLEKLVKVINEMPLSVKEPVSNETTERVDAEQQVSIEPTKPTKHTENQESVKTNNEVYDISGDVPQSELEIDPEIEKAISEAVSHILDQAANIIAEVFDFKQYIVKETTQATIEAKETFGAFKKEVVELLQIPEKPAKADMIQMVSKAIDRLEHLIMKSNVTLFTDMHMEKELMHGSAKLLNAKDALVKGDIAGAVKITTEVKETFEKMTFSPSVNRVQAFATLKTDQIMNEFLPKQIEKPVKLEAQLERVLEIFKDSTGVRQARDVAEIMRFMGINHESEVSSKIEMKDSVKSQEWIEGNVKEILLKMMKEETESRTVQNQEKTMMNLSGQQMMNQPDQEGRKQFQFFNMPFEDGETIGNMKVYMNGRKNGGQLDSQNTELYFGMSLKKHGEVGVKVTIQSGRVNLKVMSDSRAALEPLFRELLEGLDDLGYVQGEFSFENYSDGGKPMLSVQQNVKPMDYTYETEKGFDFKI